MRDQVEEATLAIGTGKVATYFGSISGAAHAYFGTIDWGFWISLLIGIGGFLMNWYYKRKDDKRADELQKEKLRHIRGELDAE